MKNWKGRLLSSGCISHDETFKRVNDNEYRHYFVSNYGQVFSAKSNRLLKPNISKPGYHIYFLSDNGSKKGFLAHRLVCQAFKPNPLNKAEVNHLDANKANNHVDNLEWCTKAENTRHAMENKLYKGWSLETKEGHEWRRINGSLQLIPVI